MSESNGIDYKAKCREYERRMGIGEENPAKDGYLVLVAILKAQNDYLKNFKLKELINSSDADKKVEYTNAKNLWEKLPDMIRSVDSLKVELKMEGSKIASIEKPISASNITEED